MKRDKYIKVIDLFDVKSGDFHATKELEPGEIPLISCGDTGQGLVDYFKIPISKIYEHAITIAYNGLPLTAKYHPYKFGAKDDVAILTPRNKMSERDLLYYATQLNRQIWRYSYGRKCFREKLKNVVIKVIEEQFISNITIRGIREYFPNKPKADSTSLKIGNLKWKDFNIIDLFDVERGHFHSLAILKPGKNMTVSRITEDNGVVGYFKRPRKAIIYPSTRITVSTVGGDSFVQLDDFIATDNVLILSPKMALNIETIYFIAFILNYQKWRYSYGRQPYLEKFKQIIIPLPVTSNGDIDEVTIADIIRNTPYWTTIKAHLKH